MPKERTSHQYKSHRLIKLLLKINLFLAIAAIAFSAVDLAFSYSQHSTHPSLTTEIGEFFNARNTNPSRRLSPQDIAWLRQGSINEDEPARWINHFYDPIHNTGWSGKHYGRLTQEQGYRRGADIAPRPSLPSIQWVTNQEYQSAYGRQYGNQTWQKAVKSYIDGDRQSALIALGHVLHLIEDLTVPDHVRDDSHPGIEGDPGSPYEEYATVQTNRGALNVAEDLARQQVGLLNFSNIQGTFQFLADYTNKNFFSEDTLSNDEFNEPSLGRIRIRQHPYVGGTIRRYIVNDDTYLGFLKSEDPFTGRVVYSTDDQFFVLPSYTSHLFPQAVQVGASVVKLFFDEVDRYRQNPSALEPIVPDSRVPFTTAMIQWPKRTIIKLCDSGSGCKDVANGIDRAIASVGNAARFLANHVSSIFSGVTARFAGNTGPAQGQEAEEMRGDAGQPVISPPAGGGEAEGRGAGSAPSAREDDEPRPVSRTNNVSRPVGRSSSPNSSNSVATTPPSTFARATTDTYPPQRGELPSGELTAPEGNPSVRQNQSERTGSAFDSLGAPTPAPASSYVAYAGGGWASASRGSEPPAQAASPVVSQTEAMATNTATTTTTTATTTTTTNTTATTSAAITSISTTTESSTSTAPTSTIITATTTLTTSTTNVATSTTTTTPPYPPAMGELGATSTTSTPTSTIITTTTTLTTSPPSGDLSQRDTADVATSTVTTTPPYPPAMGELGATSTTSTPTSTTPSSTAEETTPPHMVINEVAWAGTASFASRDEWMELYNPGAAEVSLAGWKLMVGEQEIALRGSIPAGGYYLLERTDDWTVSEIAADLIFRLSNGLSNNGERLRLVSSTGEIVDEVDASDGWFAGNNSLYRSMERINPLASGNDPNNWQDNQGPRISGKVDGGGDGTPLYGSPKQSNFGHIVLKSVQDVPVRAITRVNNPYILTYYEIPSGMALRVEEGVVIKAQFKDSKIEVRGALYVSGTGTSPVIFTSGRDQSFSSDSLNTVYSYNRAGTSSAPGDWQGIRFYPGSIGEIFQAEIRYAGRWVLVAQGLFRNRALWAESAALQIADSVFTDNAGSSIYSKNSTTTIRDTSFSSGETAVEGEGGALYLDNVAIRNTAYGVRGSPGSLPRLQMINMSSSSFENVAYPWEPAGWWGW